MLEMEVVSVKIENEILSDLETRKRDHKVWITDIAIQKVPFVEYREIGSEHYDNLYQLAKLVLQISKDENESNEVSIVYSLEDTPYTEDGKEQFGISLGSEHDVDPRNNAIAYHIIRTSFACAVVCLHNHPNLSKFSLDDVSFFLKQDNIKLMIVVTNLGSISYLVKQVNYNYLDAVDLFNEAVALHNLGTNLKDAQKAADHYLRNCYKVGIIYEDR
jgi:hypothetical protein